jgi:hypothetical protein
MNRGSTRQSVLCAVSASPECLMNRGELHRLRTGSPAHQPRPRGPDSYTHPVAARWSGTPLFVPVASRPGLRGSLFSRHRRRPAGSGCRISVKPATAAASHSSPWASPSIITEFFRDPEGRGALLNGALNGPQIASVLLVLIGAVLLRERKRPAAPAPFPGNLEVPHELTCAPSMFLRRSGRSATRPVSYRAT